VRLAKRLVELEPLKEQAHLWLMQSYADMGEQGLALQHYSECSEILTAELGIKPGREIEALRLDIVNGIAPRTSKTAPPPPNTGDKPSIAVLPFLNLSGDPQQDYFADGIV
jgi:DNA-binding SARP family transcriptional activator